MLTVFAANYQTPKSQPRRNTHPPNQKRAGAHSLWFPSPANPPYNKTCQVVTSQVGPAWGRWPQTTN